MKKTVNEKHKEVVTLLKDAINLLNDIPNRRILGTDKYKDTYEYLSVVNKFFRDNKL